MSEQRAGYAVFDVVLPLEPTHPAIPDDVYALTQLLEQAITDHSVACDELERDRNDETIARVAFEANRIMRIEETLRMARAAHLAGSEDINAFWSDWIADFCRDTGGAWLFSPVCQMAGEAG